jgi:hypothetical protein
LFIPKLEILPPAQRKVWAELGPTPDSFVLYGGTALALRLGHRQSLDFDFFSNDRFAPDELLHNIAYLHGSRVDQRGDNTLIVTIDRSGPVQISFFGDVGMRSVEAPERAPDTGLQIASLIDITATKLKTIQQRAEAKDYLDMAAALDANIALSDAIGSAIQVYGKTFNALAALKALSYFADGNLATLPEPIRQRLHSAARQVKLSLLPQSRVRKGITQQEAE